jgi:hypothetical protein
VAGKRSFAFTGAMIKPCRGSDMAAEFSIEADREHGIIRIRMGGFFTPEDVRRFLHARSVAHDALGCAPNAHLTLNDIRDMTGQLQVTVDAFQEVLEDPTEQSRRLAFVVGPTLARGQLLRALAGRNARCFSDPSDAEAWLLSEHDELPMRVRAR